MSEQKRMPKPVIRYSQAFQMEVVRELESGMMSISEIQRKYGIRGEGTVQRWLGRYGNGSRGKVIRVETPQQINELRRLKERVQRLEQALADAHIELALEKAVAQRACERAGIKDLEEFKKKRLGR
jgi:transposase-like protein